MNYQKKRLFHRALSFILMLTLLMTDSSMLSLSASTVSGGNAVITEVEAEEVTTVSGNDAADIPENGDASAEEEMEEEEYIPEIITVSGNTPVREPEDFYEKPEVENYGELVSFDEKSRTYKTGERSYVTVIGADASTYIDEDGKLTPVDNTLVENPVSTLGTVGGRSYVNSANDYMAMFNESAAPGEALYSCIYGDYVLSVIPMEGSFASGVTRDNAIRYNNVFENIDYQYTLIGGSVKEDIILLDRTAKNTFSYLVQAEGLLYVQEDNTLYFYEEGTDPFAEAVFAFDVPVMEDAAGEVSFALRMDTAETPDGVAVTVTASESWLNAPERVYPVRIDPTAINVSGSAIRIACAEQGSPSMAIGDNGYPYVGYDDGEKSGNLENYGTAHKECRSYFAIDYDFASLAEEPEIVSATLNVAQQTCWSKGKTMFGVYMVEQPWRVNSLTWNNQKDYGHSFLSSQYAAPVSREMLSFDVTEAVSAWVNGSAENNGLVMKTHIQGTASSEAVGAYMQCEVLYSSANERYAPKLIISWTGDATDLSSLTLDDTTISIYPVVAKNSDKCTTTLGVAAHGLAKPGSTVTYRLINGTTGSVEAEESLLYPDTTKYTAFSSAMEYKRRLSNWQSEVFSNLTPGVVYRIEAYASMDGETGETVTSDSFLIYEEQTFDLVPKIANHYRVSLDTIMSDMRMQDCLTKAGNKLFIRNPGNTAAYVSGEPDILTQILVDGLLLGRAEDCEFGFEPVNLNTGNFYMSQRDVTMADIGGDFTFDRTYNSKAAGFSGSFGYGWSFAYDERLGELADGSILWLKGDGGAITFMGTPEGYSAPAGQDYTLTTVGDDYRITDKATGEVHQFDAFGLLVKCIDISGNTVTLSYDGNYCLQKITSPSGKEFKITLDEKERITAITQPDGYGVTFTYDAAGNLVKVVNQAGYVRSYAYDGNHYMTSWADENGNTVIVNEYDAQGRVVKQTDAEGGVVTLSYAEGQTTTTDANGNVTVYTYDESYRTTGIAYPDGTSVSKVYNAAGYVSAETDREGVKTTFTYDGNGNLLSQTREDGSKQTYTYNDLNQVTSVTDYAGATTIYVYDEKGRLLSVTDGEGSTTSYTYDELNRVTGMVDASGNSTAFEYTGAVVSKVTDALGGVTTYAYDAMNRATAVTDAEGNTTQTIYDALGRGVQEVDGLGNVTTYGYSPVGEVLSITDKEGKVTTFTYDKLSRMLGGTDPLGNTLTYTYDANGNKLTETNAEGEVINYTYDTMNRVVAATDAEGNTESYTYNGRDSIVTITDRRGGTTVRTYDKVTGALVTETDAEGSTTSYTSDALGRVTGITYADGSAESYTYDKAGRLSGYINRAGLVTTYTYDKNGNVITIAEGEHTYQYRYDALNRLVETTDPLGNKNSYTYDKVGNAISVTDGNGNATSYAYDALSQLVKAVDAEGGMLS
ncbi:MAG: RHS repeat protein, partial [Lachnospiraceae bacterium]|nr:RHS repeat protein [Lachnospiraceae bacterium]